MSAIHGVNLKNYIEHNFPTLDAVLKSDTWKKVAFVFVSIVTLGLVPLLMIVYDLSRSSVNRTIPNQIHERLSAKAILAILAGVHVFLKVKFDIDMISPVVDSFFKNVSHLINTYPLSSTAGVVLLAGLYFTKKGLEYDPSKVHQNKFFGGNDEKKVRSYSYSEQADSFVSPSDSYPRGCVPSAPPRPANEDDRFIEA